MTAYRSGLCSVTYLAMHCNSCNPSTPSHAYMHCPSFRGFPLTLQEQLATRSGAHDLSGVAYILNVLEKFLAMSVKAGVTQATGATAAGVSPAVAGVTQAPTSVQTLQV